ncbi:MAG: hypothetical protein AABY22_03155 [Nanoarchaeota archaeon]
MNIDQIKLSVKIARDIVVEMELKRRVILEKEYIKFLSQIKKHLEEIENNL